MRDYVAIATWPFGMLAVEAAARLLAQGRPALEAAIAGTQAVEVVEGIRAGRSAQEACALAITRVNTIARRRGVQPAGMAFIALDPEGEGRGRPAPPRRHFSTPAQTRESGAALCQSMMLKNGTTC